MNITGMVGFVLIANNYENFEEASKEFYLVSPLRIIVETIQGLHTIQIMPSIILLGASIGTCVSSICDKIEQQVDAIALAHRMPQINEFIERKSREVSSEDAEIACAICLENLQDAESKVVQLDCDRGHVFHPDCLKQWMI